jgi:hypothetical protein
MFQSPELKNYVETSHTLETTALVLAEWNLNQPENIERIGNYRYRPSDSSSIYSTLPISYDPLDSGSYYTGATDSDVSIDGGYERDESNNLVPVSFTLPKDKFKMLYSLEDCFLPFRPRSGINKPVYLGISGASPTLSQYITNPSVYDDNGFDVVNEGYIVNRPRYYMSSRYDQFKYWTSYRTESGVEYGVSQTPINGRSYISDSCPFVVYKEPLTPNRIVVKMQTNVGDIDLGPMRTLDSSDTIPDPFYGYSNQTTPVRWRVQVLKDGSWNDAISFDENSSQSDGSPIIGSDGHVEIAYGLILPDRYKTIFVFAQEIPSSVLPTTAPHGYAYLLKDSEYERGIFAIFYEDEWEYFTPEYGWALAESFISKQSNFVSKLIDPDYFIENQKKVYREIDIIDGIRIVVDTMNKPNCTFDLIEMSPRIVSNISDRVLDFSVTKTLGDLGNSKVPVGSLLAGTGSINISNSDLAFIDTNAFNVTSSLGSIVSNYLTTNTKFLFYETIRNVNVDGLDYDYYVPIKTLYSEGFPQSQANFDSISMSLRDGFFILESSPAPSLMLTDISLSNAIIAVLDYIGFSNYVFKRLAGQKDIIIPFFFVAPDQNVAEILNDLAIATQTAMFFDEYNNFVVMTKEYLMPDLGKRNTDMSLYGQETDGKLPNIIQVSSANKAVNNNGQINYTKRYIQRSYGSTRQAYSTDEFKTWIYAPTLLWEVTGDQTTKSSNETSTEQSSYVLTAMPLKTDLTDATPSVVNNSVINNVIDVGESVYSIARYNGYFYANGEVIKYDAVEYSVTVSIWYPLKEDGTLDYSQPILLPQGRLAPSTVPEDQVYEWRNSHRQGSSTVWINSVDEYQKYLLQLPFNGKMYPTGNIRIWTEPEYVVIDGNTIMKTGPVRAHGRGQFGTPITYHSAGLGAYWSNNDNVYGAVQESQYIFSTSQVATYPLGISDSTAGGVSPAKAKSSSRNGIIKNTLSQKYWTEKEVNEFRVAEAGTVQSSALVFTGPTFGEEEKPRNYVSYVHKKLDNAYKHYGTRMRIIGKTEVGGSKVQTPIGSSEYFTVSPNSNDQQVNISGGSGGIGIMVDPVKNTGYFFEIVALTTGNISGYYDDDKKTIVSYNIPLGNVSLSGSGNRYVTIKTTVDHQFNVGDKVVVVGFAKGAATSEINGEWTITSKTARSFTYDTGVSISGAPTTGGVAEIYIETGVNINNIVFYKTLSQDGKSYPVKLWSGFGKILVDSGRFAGQYRMVAEENPTVYDLAVEYRDVGSSRVFYLYINDKQVATVVDDSPITKSSNVSLFVRGSSKCMFENVYALTENYSQETIGNVVDNISEVFGDREINTSEALRKYAVSGFVQAAYLNNISSYQPPEFKMYFDEFGTIMRECAHFNIKYDRAYPALYARLAPTLNRVKTYSSSGFYADAYGADFLVFNCTDNKINLDPTTGNFLRIQGITFTQNTTKTLTVDDYFTKVSNFSDPQFEGDSLIYSPLYEKELYNQIKISRQRHGNQEFSLDTTYIQTDDAAEDILGWIVKKTMNPKKNIGMTTFGTQLMQLGDIVTVNYKKDETDVITSPDKQFVVYNIEYKRTLNTPEMTVYLAEV